MYEFNRFTKPRLQLGGWPYQLLTALLNPLASGLFSVALRVTERRMYRDSIGREAKHRATRRQIVRHMKQPT